MIHRPGGYMSDEPREKKILSLKARGLGSSMLVNDIVVSGKKVSGPTPSCNCHLGLQRRPDGHWECLNPRCRELAE